MDSSLAHGFHAASDFSTKCAVPDRRRVVFACLQPKNFPILVPEPLSRDPLYRRPRFTGSQASLKLLETGRRFLMTQVVSRWQVSSCSALP